MSVIALPTKTTASGNRTLAQPIPGTSVPLCQPRQAAPTEDREAFAFRGVGKRFGDKTVLSGIDLTVPPASSSPSSAKAAVAKAHCCVF